MFIKIVQLPRFKSISFQVRDHASPELVAWSQLRAYANPRGLLNSRSVHQVFGRNNPMSAGNPQMHGYELLLTIPDDFPIENGNRELEFEGGLFAVVSAQGIAQMQSNWETLVKWVEQHSVYTHGYPKDYDFNNQPSLELEHFIDPTRELENTLIIDYYYPIVENLQNT
jgi:DNA gyrase inhibitor GyrI